MLLMGIEVCQCNFKKLYIKITSRGSISRWWSRRVEGHALIPFCKSTKITTSCWTTIDRRLENTKKKKIPHVQRQRSSSSEMVGGAQSWYNLIPFPSWGRPTNWRTITPRKFSHCCDYSEPYFRLPSLGTWQKDWEPPGTPTLKPSRIWL